MFTKIQFLIIGRLATVFVLLITGWVWYSRSLDLTYADLPSGPMLVFAISVGMTAVYFFLARLSSRWELQVRFQFIIDIFLVTWLIWQTGDLTSPYVTLYLVIIGVSSIFLGPGQTLMTAIISIFILILLAVMIGANVINGTGEVVSVPRMIQITSFHTVAILVVGLLAARLSERRASGEKLVEATKDLAQLKALHERIVESIGSGLITTDLKGTIFTYNLAATEITGIEAARMRGRPITELLPNFEEAVQQTFQDSSDGDNKARFEAELTSSGGFAIWIGYGISRLYSEENEESGYIVAFQDLTEIRSMEANVRRKDRLAAVGRVGAGLAHEIRNPLGAMRGAIQVLESTTPKDSVQADLMGIILRESDRLNGIITNFLSYARPRSGNFSEIDVCEVARETMTLLRHSPDVSDKHELIEVLPDEPVTAYADSSQLKQVFWNLARNALNAMPTGGKLTVKIERIESKRVRITFEDSGVGMPAEKVEQLFEPFSSSTTGGTGLGLSIVYQIVRDHTGTINVKSSEGEGTTITVEVPGTNQPNVGPGDQTIDAARTPLTELLNVIEE